ncbi:hypothetical protein SRHO_G00100950 [Serrasalmus rhombeus]
MPTVKHPETIHVWGCFSAKGIGSLAVLPKNTAMNKEWYQNVLREQLLPTVQEQFDLWKVLTTVTVSCLVAVVLVLLSWICFYKRKGYAVKHNQEHVYDSIDDTMPTAQPVITLNK